MNRGSSDANGFWCTSCDRRRSGRSRRAPASVTSSPSSSTVPASGVVSRSDEPGDGRLARPGLADERERVRPRGTREAHVVDRAGPCGPRARAAGTSLLDATATSQQRRPRPDRRRHAARGAAVAAPCSARRGGRAAAACTAWRRVRRAPAPVGPCSTISPSFITTIRSARSAATPRSWVMSRTADAGARGEVVEEVEDAALHRDVERARRLVGDDQLRARAASAMAMSTRWRMPPDSSCGYCRARSLRVGQPDRPRGSRPPAPRRPRGRARPWMRSTSATWSPIRVHRVERRCPGPAAPARSARRAPAASAFAGQPDQLAARAAGRCRRRPGRRAGSSPTTACAVVRLAGAGLADERDDLAGVRRRSSTPRTRRARRSSRPAYSTDQVADLQDGAVGALIGAPSLSSDATEPVGGQHERGDRRGRAGW